MDARVAFRRASRGSAWTPYGGDCIFGGIVTLAIPMVSVKTSLGALRATDRHREIPVRTILMDVKGFTAFLLVLATVALATSLLAGTASGEEDSIVFNRQPVEGRITVYVGEEPYFGWEFGSNWSRWSVSFECALFDREIRDMYNEPVTRGSSCSGNTIIRPNAGVGEYPLTVRVNRTDMQNTSEAVNWTAIIDYRWAVEVLDFHIERGFWGTELVLDVRIHVEIDELQMDLVVWEDFSTSPGDIDLRDVAPGEYHFTSKVRPEGGRGSEVRAIGYHYYALFGDHYMEVDFEEEDPEIMRGEGPGYALAVLLLILILSVILIFVVWRKRRGDGTTKGPVKPP